MCQCQFERGNVLIDGWSQTHYAILGRSIETPRPKSCNAGNRETWIDTSNCRPVIGIKNMIEITSLNTITIG